MIELLYNMDLRIVVVVINYYKVSTSVFECKRTVEGHVVE